ncbi:hypothetical protein EJ08DRAFT_684701 [Tothia fuscella]|uniref:Uncharacterized protein n=1 Tax=Tothia fuscella TaxID=1048955 RepID=A0A9P4P4F9_9PEZI|nr:hypothetical protein EJ08DRAFT_684701 [Tothia fuscella]
MPLQPGEVSLLTVFADVHSYFGSPAAKPVHHRFDKKSYLYLYHDVMNKRGRVEVANHPGTADQDAFSGYLDMSSVEYSYKQPNLFSITVESQRSASSPAPSPHNDISQWHLPAFDLRSENKYMYKIQTLEFYLFTTDNASLFLDSLKRVLHPDQLRILDAPASIPEHGSSMSPVIQKLEHAAITTPNPYLRSDSISTTHTNNSFAPPPTNHTPVSPPSSTPQPTSSFAPAAYNPAAPAAPEPIAHREKTPPPPDSDGGTGLMGAAVNDQGSQYPFPGAPQQHFTPQQHGAYTPGPPSMPPPPNQALQRSHTMASVSSLSSSMPPPPQSPYASSFAGPPQGTPSQDPNAHLYGQQPPTPGLHRQATMPASYTPGQQQQSSPAPQTQYASYPSNYAPGAAPGIGAPPTPGQPQTPSYGAPLQSPGLYNSQQQPQQHQQQYAYGQHNPQAVQHGIHGQVYRPEEGKPAGVAGGGQAAATGKFEQRAEKIEKGVGRFLKKLDKKF